MGLLQQEIAKSLELSGNHRRLQELRAELGGLREKTQRWVEQGTYRRPYALEKFREQLQRIAKKHHESIQEEARDHRSRFEFAQREVLEDMRRIPAVAQIRREEREFEARLSSNDELTAKLYGFTSANDPLSAVTHFSSYDDLIAVFGEAQRRGLESAVESFRKAWAEQPFKLNRTCFDHPHTVVDLQRALELESIPEGTLLLERHGEDGSVLGEYTTDVSNIVDEGVLDVLAD